SPRLPFPFPSLIQHPLENGSGGAPDTSEHDGVPTPAIRSCRRQRPTLSRSRTILDLTASFRVAARLAAPGPAWLHLEGTARRRIPAGESAAGAPHPAGEVGDGATRRTWGPRCEGAAGTSGVLTGDLGGPAGGARRGGQRRQRPPSCLHRSCVLACCCSVSRAKLGLSESTTRQACNFSRRSRTSSSPACLPWEVDR
ncbi:unnamed protein product, partial [Urochloa humidicola]